MDITNVLSSYFMTIDMHRYALLWLVYSRNKFFRVDQNISEKIVPGGGNFREVQIKRDKPVSEVKRSGADVQVVSCYCYLVVSHPFVEQLYS